MQQKGSILVLTIMAVLILSGMAITGLTISSTEIQSTRNFYMNKRAYYAAVEGVEQVRDQIYENPDPAVVTTISKSIADTHAEDRHINRSYITGSMEDMQYIEQGYDPPYGLLVTAFDGFEPPPLTGISLGATSTIAPIIWRVNITSRVNWGGGDAMRKSYAEIETGIYSIVTVAD